MTITSSAFVKDLFGGLSSHFEGSLAEHADEYTQLFDDVDSDKRYEEHVQRTTFGLAPVKPEGEPIQYDSAQEGFTSRITNVTYALGFKITEEAVEDNLYMDAGQECTTWLARAMNQTREHVSANIYNRAFNSAYAGGDGVELLSAAHPSLSGNQSNEMATASDLSEAALETLAIQIMDMTDDRGNKISLKPKRLIVPTALFFEASRILDSELRVGTENNDLNVLKAKGTIPEVATNHYLTDSDAFFIRTDLPQGEGLIFQKRRAVRFRQDDEFTNSNLCYKADERYGVGWKSWRGIVGSPGAA